MGLYDEKGNRIITADPKPEPKRKKSAKPLGQNVSRTIKEQNKINRNFGKDTERTVAKLVGGSRVPASGAIKTSTFGLVGDVQVKYPDSQQVLALIECKGTSGISPKGDKTFSLKKSVLDQCGKEAKSLNALGATWIHWKNGEYTQDDYVILSSQDFIKLVQLAKVEFVK